MTNTNLGRLLSKVRKLENGCWEYTGALRPDGYGAFWMNDRTGAAHRASYTLHTGAIADDLLIAHTCDNRACVNPAHLMAVTPQENVRDTISKGRHRPMRGERSRNAKITLQQRNEIMQRYGTGESSVKLSKEYGLTARYIRRLAAGDAWRWADGPKTDSPQGSGRQNT